MHAGSEPQSPSRGPRRRSLPGPARVLAAQEARTPQQRSPRHSSCSSPTSTSSTTTASTSSPTRASCAPSASSGSPAPSTSRRPRRQYIPNLAQAARKGADLVVSVGFDQANAVAKVAKQFPKTHFAIIDVDQTTLAGKPKNVEGLIFKEQEVGYLAGYLAGLIEKPKSGHATIGRSAARSSRPSTGTSRATRRERRRPTRASSC